MIKYKAQLAAIIIAALAIGFIIPVLILDIYDQEWKWCIMLSLWLILDVICLISTTTNLCWDLKYLGDD